jgi:hypothetical protein
VSERGFARFLVRPDCGGGMIGINVGLLKEGVVYQVIDALDELLVTELGPSPLSLPSEESIRRFRFCNGWSYDQIYEDLGGNALRTIAELEKPDPTPAGGQPAGLPADLGSASSPDPEELDAEARKITTPEGVRDLMRRLKAARPAATAAFEVVEEVLVRALERVGELEAEEAMTRAEELEALRGPAKEPVPEFVRIVRAASEDEHRRAALATREVPVRAEIDALVSDAGRR